jgi:hypothetical protein
MRIVSFFKPLIMVFSMFILFVGFANQQDLCSFAGVVGSHQLVLSVAINNNESFDIARAYIQEQRRNVVLRSHSTIMEAIIFDNDERGRERGRERKGERMRKKYTHLAQAKCDKHTKQDVFFATWQTFPYPYRARNVNVLCCSSTLPFVHAVVVVVVVIIIVVVDDVEWRHNRLFR